MFLSITVLEIQQLQILVQIWENGEFVAKIVFKWKWFYENVILIFFWHYSLKIKKSPRWPLLYWRNYKCSKHLDIDKSRYFVIMMHDAPWCMTHLLWFARYNQKLVWSRGHLLVIEEKAKRCCNQTHFKNECTTLNVSLYIYNSNYFIYTLIKFFFFFLPLTINFSCYKVNKCILYQWFAIVNCLSKSLSQWKWYCFYEVCIVFTEQTVNHHTLYIYTHTLWELRSEPTKPSLLQHLLYRK